jgi:hypothetical protein
MNTLLKLISDPDHEPSTMRVCVLLIVGGFMFVWCWLSIKTGQFAQPPGSMISLLIGALGCKSAQSWAENLPMQTSNSKNLQPQINTDEHR